MAARFWVGGSGSWSDTAHWSTTSGGAGGQTVPSTGDNVTIDGHASGLNGGTLTIDQAIACQNIVWGAAIGTIDNSGNHNVSLTGAASVWFAGTGTGARTWTGGSGTYTLTGAPSPSASLLNMGTVTNLTNPTTAFASATFVLVNTSALPASFAGGGCTYGTVTLTGHSSKGGYAITGANTIATMNVTAPNYVAFGNGVTLAITNGFTLSGTSADRITLCSNNATVNATISCANACTLDYGFVRGITFGGGGSFAATNSYDLGSNSSVTITAPTGGGSPGVIGG